MHNYYKLRTDLQISSADKIIQYLLTVTNSMAYVIEGSLSDNPHMHFYLEINVSNQIVRRNMRLLCGKGNGAYSLKQVDRYPIEYLAYMLKDGKVTYVNIPEDIKQESIAYNAKVAAEIKAKKADKIPRWKQLTSKILPDLQYTEIKGNKVYTFTHNEEKYHPTLELITERTILVMTEEDILITPHYLNNLALTLCLKYVNGYKQTYKRKMLSNLQPSLWEK